MAHLEEHDDLLPPDEDQQQLPRAFSVATAGPPSNPDAAASRSKRPILDIINLLSESEDEDKNLDDVETTFRAFQIKKRPKYEEEKLPLQLPSIVVEIPFVLETPGRPVGLVFDPAPNNKWWVICADRHAECYLRPPKRSRSREEIKLPYGVVVDYAVLDHTLLVIMRQADESTALYVVNLAYQQPVAERLFQAPPNRDTARAVSGIGAETPHSVEEKKKNKSKSPAELVARQHENRRLDQVTSELSQTASFKPGTCSQPLLTDLKNDALSAVAVDAIGGEVYVGTAQGKIYTVKIDGPLVNAAGARRWQADGIPAWRFAARVLVELDIDTGGAPIRSIYAMPSGMYVATKRNLLTCPRVSGTYSFRTQIVETALSPLSVLEVSRTLVVANGKDDSPKQRSVQLHQPPVMECIKGDWEPVRLVTDGNTFFVVSEEEGGKIRQFQIVRATN